MQSNQEKTNNCKLLRIKEVERLTTLAKSTIYLKARNKDDPFPSSRKLTANVSVWLESDITNWINKQLQTETGAV